MNDQLTVAELEKRWGDVLTATRFAVGKHPGAYREIKSLANDIVEKPLDIREYLPAVEKLAGLLEVMDPKNQGSIFFLFKDRVRPSSIRQVPLLRVECKDLLAHLKAYDNWFIETRPMKVVK